MASKDFLGFGPRTKTMIIPKFRGYRFPGRADPSRIGENGLLDEPRNGEFLRHFVDINRPELVDFS
jgi:hypothetical protein